MDACDPDINIQNLKTLIKQNIGTDLKLTRSQICDVYSTIQDGKLPLPPLIMSSDRSFLMDRKSPISRSDFEKLFSPTTKVASIRRIAKKVGVTRHADPGLTKAQLINIIGNRLHGLNIHEPIKLRNVPKKKTETNYNNSNTTFNYNNRNANENVNANANANANAKENLNRNANANANVNNNSKVKNTFKIKAARLPFKKNNNSGKPGIFTKAKIVNEINRRKVERNYNSMFEKYFPRRRNRIMSSNELSYREAEKTKFFSNTPENAYKKLTSQGKINESYSNFKPKYEKEKKKYYKITNSENIQNSNRKPKFIKGAKTPFGKSSTTTRQTNAIQKNNTQVTPNRNTSEVQKVNNKGNVSKNTEVTSNRNANTIQVSTPETVTGPSVIIQQPSVNVPGTKPRNLNANFKKTQREELEKYLNDKEIENKNIRNNFIKMFNNGTNLPNIKLKIRNKIEKNLKEQQEKNNALRKEQQEKNNLNRRRSESNQLKNRYNNYNLVSVNQKNKIISNYINGKKKQVKSGFLRGLKNSNMPMYASIANVEEEIKKIQKQEKAKKNANALKTKINQNAKNAKAAKIKESLAKKQKKQNNKNAKDKQLQLEKNARYKYVVALLKRNKYQFVKESPEVQRIAERYIDQKPFAAKSIEEVNAKIRKLIKTKREGTQRKERIALAKYAKAQGLNLKNQEVKNIILNPTTTNKNINELIETRKQEKQKREEEVQDIRNNEEGNINTNVNTILKKYVNGKSEYSNIENVKEAIEKLKKNKGLIAEQKEKNKEKLEKKVEMYKGPYGNIFNTMSKPVINAFNKGTINYKKADKELNKIAQKKSNNNTKAANLNRKKTEANSLRNTYKNKKNDTRVQKVISNFQTQKPKRIFSSNIKYKTINNATTAIKKINRNNQIKQFKSNEKQKKIKEKEDKKQANLQKRQESRKEFEQFLKNQTNPRLSYENIMKIRSISLLHNHVHLRGKNVSVAKKEAKKIIDDKKKEILKLPNKNTENNNEKVKRINQEAEKRKLAKLEVSKKIQTNELANYKKRQNAILEEKKKQAKVLANAARVRKENLDIRKRLKQKVQKAQFKNQSDKRKLLEQINNHKSMTGKELEPKINDSIKQLALNGNINENAYKINREKVKKQISEYISEKYKNMPKNKRKEYIKSANLDTRSRLSLFYRNRPKSFNDIKKIIDKNMKPTPPNNIKRKQVQAKLINTMTTNNTLKKKKENLVSEIKKKMKPTVNAKQQGAATQVLKNTKRNFTQKVNKSKTQTNLNQIKKNFNSKVLKLQKQKWVN